jgi:hypothetical protein
MPGFWASTSRIPHRIRRFDNQTCSRPTKALTVLGDKSIFSVIELGPVIRTAVSTSLICFMQAGDSSTIWADIPNCTVAHHRRQTSQLPSWRTEIWLTASSWYPWRKSPFILRTVIPTFPVGNMFQMRCLQPLKPISSFKCRQIYANKLYVLPTQCIYVFCMDLRKTAIISLRIINGMVCIMETECVYCAVELNLYV